MTELVSDVDLGVCAREPIRVPGAIQPHGVLLALDDELRIVRASSNSQVLLDRSVDELLGLPVGEVLANVPFADLAQPDMTLVNPMSLRLRSGAAVDGVASRSGGLLLLEQVHHPLTDEAARVSLSRHHLLGRRLSASGDSEIRV